MIGTAASVVALVGAAFTLIQQVQSAREKVKGTSKALDNVSKQLEGLVGSLNLVKEEERLQTAAVRQQVTAIIGVEEELSGMITQVVNEGQKQLLVHMADLMDGQDVGMVQT